MKKIALLFTILIGVSIIIYTNIKTNKNISHESSEGLSEELLVELKKYELDMMFSDIESSIGEDKGDDVNDGEGNKGIPLTDEQPKDEDFKDEVSITKENTKNTFNTKPISYYANLKKQVLNSTKPLEKKIELINEIETFINIDKVSKKNNNIKIIASLIFTIAALFVVLSKKYDDEVKKWAIGALTLIAGVWIGTLI